MKEFLNHWAIKSLLITIAVAWPTMALFIDQNTSEGVAAVYGISIMTFSGLLAMHFQDKQREADDRGRASKRHNVA